MPVAQLPGDLQMYYEDDDFTDPWTTPETVIRHHGNATSSGRSGKILASCLSYVPIVQHGTP